MHVILDKVRVGILVEAYAASLRSLSTMVEGFALIHLVGDIYTI